MKEITVENFNYSNVKAWIADYSHKEKVEFAIYCAELVIDLYKGGSDAPRLAIEAAKDWALNPSEENKQKCKGAAAAAAAYAAAYAAAAAAAAAYAAAAYAADADAAAAYAADAAAADASAAYAADAASADASARKSIKDKIINYISNKLAPQTKEVEWVNGLPPVGSIVHGRFMHTSATDGKWQIDYISESVGVYTAVETGKQFTFATDNVILSKIETEAERIERERIESAKSLYSKHCKAVRHPVKDLDNNAELLNAWLVIVDETGYRKESE